MNEYDSSRIIDLLKVNYNLSQKDSPAKADLLIVITCSIREKAEEKIFSEIGRWKHLKKNNPNLVIAVGGCVASQEGKNIIRRAPFVDIVFGPQTIHRLGAFIEQIKINKQNDKNNNNLMPIYHNSHQPVIDISFPKIEKFSYLPKTRQKNKSAACTIMEGCNNFCTYCVVPYTRGGEISRPYDDIIEECKHLEENGTIEITLLGQNVNSYQYKMPNNETKDLASIINHISTFVGIERIRFMTSNPMKFNDNIIDCYANILKLANHLHLPVQSGSNRILKLMNRDYTKEKFTEIITSIRKVRPNISVSSDFIVGFPGETDLDFNDTLKLVKDLNFDQSFSFIYSPRPNTKAATLPDNIPLSIKKERLNLLQTTLKEQANNITKAMVDTIQNVFVTGYSKKFENKLIGKTENNRKVVFSGCEKTIGKIIPIKITEISNNILFGQM